MWQSLDPPGCHLSRFAWGDPLVEQYPRPMRLLGIPVSDDDARHLIATLVVEGTPDALTAAAQITKGVERGR